MDGPEVFDVPSFKGSGLAGIESPGFRSIEESRETDGLVPRCTKLAVMPAR